MENKGTETRASCAYDYTPIHGVRLNVEPGVPLFEYLNTRTTQLRALSVAMSSPEYIDSNLTVEMRSGLSWLQCSLVEEVCALTGMVIDHATGGRNRVKSPSANTAGAPPGG